MSPGPLQIRLWWGGLAALLGLAMLGWSPRLPRDPFPLVAALALIAGLLFRLRTGPLLFLGVWIFGELRPLLPNPQGYPWSQLPGDPAAGSQALLVAVVVGFVFASCQYQFLSAGTHRKARRAFAVTLADPSPAAVGVRWALALLARALLMAATVGVFLAGADWVGETSVGYLLDEAGRKGALFWQGVAVFVAVSVAVDLVRFLSLDRTAAACYLNDWVWHSHRGIWTSIDRRTP